MFTGIIEELGTVVDVVDLGSAARLRVRGELVTADARHGDSIAVNGVCLTVVTLADGCFTADVMAESLKRSSLGAHSITQCLALEITSGRQEANIISSPSPCSRRTRRQRFARSDPFQRG